MSVLARCLSYRSVRSVCSCMKKMQTNHHSFRLCDQHCLGIKNNNIELEDIVLLAKLNVPEIIV